MKHFLPFALVLAASPFVAPRAPAAAAPAAPGGGAVLAMQQQFFAAIDAGDPTKAMQFLDLRDAGGWSEGENGGIALPSVMWLDPRGAPEQAQGADAVRVLVAKHAKESDDGGPRWTTKFIRSRSDCYSADLSYCVAEFERTRGVKGGTQRYRATSLVRQVEGQWRLFHLHVSPADEATARVIADAEKR